MTLSSKSYSKELFKNLFNLGFLKVTEHRNFYLICSYEHTLGDIVLERWCGDSCHFRLGCLLVSLKDKIPDTWTSGQTWASSPVLKKLPTIKIQCF